MQKHKYSRLKSDKCNYDYVNIGDEIFVDDVNELDHCLQNKEFQKKIVIKGIRRLLDNNLKQFTIFSITDSIQKKTIEILLNHESAVLTMEKDLKDSLEIEDYGSCVIARDLLLELNNKQINEFFKNDKNK